MVKAPEKANKFLACSLVFRGNGVPWEINSAIESIKKEKILPYLDWCSKNQKIVINSEPPSFVPKGDLAPVNKSLCMYQNSTNIS